MNIHFGIVILTICCFGNINTYNFEQQDLRTGISFVKLSKARISYDSYTLLYHLDISEYKDLTIILERNIKVANLLCQKMTGGKINETCKILITQTESQLLHMKRDELDIEAYQQKEKLRNKRSLEFAGSFLHWAFGLMDADTAREYDRKINQLQHNSSRIHNILEEQTILIREVIQLNNKSLTNFETQMGKLQRSIQQYAEDNTKHMHYLRAEIVFNEAISLIKMVIMEHQRVSQQILRCLEDVVSGKITQLIPKDKLTNDLLYIESHLRENQRLPINFNIENPLHIFKYSKISTSLFDNRLLMEVTIPVVERESYTVYKIIPIPTSINNLTVIINPSTYHVLINDEQKEYVPITEKEFVKGKFNLRGEKIIKPAENARIEYSQNCEISIFMNPTKDTILQHCDIKVIPNSNYFISLNSNDMFYAKIMKPLIVTEYCRGKPVQNYEIHENGLLQLEKECRIITDKVSLRPRANFRFESKDVIVLANITQKITLESISDKLHTIFNITIPHLDENVLIQDFTSDYNNLFEKAEKLIEKTKLNSKMEEIHYDNINNSKKTYITIFLIVMIVLSIIIFLVWYFYTQFFNLGTWVKLATKLGNENIDNIPKLFVRNINTEERQDILQSNNGSNGNSSIIEVVE